MHQLFSSSSYLLGVSFDPDQRVGCVLSYLERKPTHLDLIWLWAPGNLIPAFWRWFQSVNIRCPYRRCHIQRALLFFMLGPFGPSFLCIAAYTMQNFRGLFRWGNDSSVAPSNSVRFPVTLAIGCAIGVNSRRNSCRNKSSNFKTDDRKRE